MQAKPDHMSNCKLSVKQSEMQPARDSAKSRMPLLKSTRKEPKLELGKTVTTKKIVSTNGNKSVSQQPEHQELTYP
jgi:hypothetical protein